MNKFNRKDLVQLVAEKGHFSKKDARTAIDLVFGEIENALLEGREVNITNFGVFTPKKRKERKGTHPKKHTPIKIDKSRTVGFRLSKKLKNELNK
ncbi:MAG TPA: HU family DNA-binding protein [Erysipelotrichaceae bacterium]|nr:HU family DNA-binding protein [Erysipelotrichaceae bacterium]